MMKIIKFFLIISIFNFLYAREQEEKKVLRTNEGIETIIQCGKDEGGSVEFESNSLEKRKKDITFKAVIVLKCPRDNEDCLRLVKNQLNLQCPDIICDRSCNCPKSYSSPLQRRGTRPYEEGDGGLLNPLLKKYKVKCEKIEGENYVGVRSEVSGVVSADGIAAYEFDETQYGNGYYVPEKRIDPNTGKEYTVTYIWEPSLLEQAILGAVKERASDRQLSDLTDYYFPSEGGRFAEKFRKCVKEEWSSKIDNDDEGTRSPECTELIKKHFPRSVYWPSQWSSKKDERKGEHEINVRRNSKDDISSQELTEFEVFVEL